MSRDTGLSTTRVFQRRANTRQACLINTAAYLGKSANCQVAVSLSIATEKASLPVDYRLYLPEAWVEGSERCKGVGIPDDIQFLTKPEIALAQIQAAYERDVLTGVALADAGYGNNTAFREGLDALGLLYIVGVNPSTSIWPPGVKPLPPKPRVSGTRGRASTRHRFAKGHEQQSCEQVALAVDDDEWEFVEWREGTNETLSGWFTALRVRAAHRDHKKSVLRDEQWLLVEWPEQEQAPTKYSLSTLPATASLQELVYNVKMRWRIERDYQELKDELGLNHYEGRNWRGFHHHASLCIAAYAFLVAERLAPPDGRKKHRATQKTCLTRRLHSARFPAEPNVMWMIQSAHCVGKSHKPSLLHLFAVLAARTGPKIHPNIHNTVGLVDGITIPFIEVNFAIFEAWLVLKDEDNETRFTALKDAFQIARRNGRVTSC